MRHAPRSSALGIARLAQLRAVAGLPVGSREPRVRVRTASTWKDQPAFLEQMLAPSDSFLLLDVHNLYCQAINYGLDPLALIER